MGSQWVRRAALAAVGAALLATLGCARSAPREYDAAPAVAVAPAEPADLAGGPPAPQAGAATDSYAPPPANFTETPPPPPPAEPLVFTPMQPIPNPPERAQVRPARLHRAEAASQAPSPRRRGRHHAHRLSRHTAAVGAPSSASHGPASKARLSELQVAASAAVSRGAILSLAPQIAQGESGVVTLSLPGDLLETLQAAAAKAGFGREARKVEIRATLAGEGFIINPMTEQSIALRPGQPAELAWQALPAQGAKGPLKVQLQAALTGRGMPQILFLAPVQSAAIPAPAPGPSAAHRFRFPHLPGWGGQSAADETAGLPPAPDHEPLHSPAVTLGLLGFIALVLGALFYREQGRRRQRAAQRRRAPPYQPGSPQQPSS